MGRSGQVAQIVSIDAAASGAGEYVVDGTIETSESFRTNVQ